MFNCLRWIEVSLEEPSSPEDRQSLLEDSDAKSFGSLDRKARVCVYSATDNRTFEAVVGCQRDPSPKKCRTDGVLTRVSPDKCRTHRARTYLLISTTATTLPPQVVLVELAASVEGRVAEGPTHIPGVQPAMTEEDYALVEEVTPPFSNAQCPVAYFGITWREPTS